MNLTKEQLELLRRIVEVYDSGCTEPFIFVRPRTGSAVLAYSGYANVQVDADISDLRQLERESLVTPIQLLPAGEATGKPTAKGIQLVHSSSLAQEQKKDELPEETTGEHTLGAAPEVNSAPPEKQQPAIFIGHGRAKEWLELKDFLRDRLHLDCVEFNSDSAAGLSTQQRLEEMLNQATFAFLVMTAEDEHADGRCHARENVIHEAGLFQGKLGFRKAVLLVEEGCERPSNVHGLTYLDFPKGRIRAAFEEVRRVLEREFANDAQLAMKMSSEVANVPGRLTDVRQQALALQNENQGLRDEIRELNARLAEAVEAEPCPRCHRKGWHVESSEPDLVFGDLGSSRRTYKCHLCGFSESKLTQ
jgi:predicted nucleotide-binding protein